MYRLLPIVAAAVVLAGCATNSDGSTTLGVKGSPAWHDSAPRKDVEAYYDQMEVHDLCILWDRTRNKPEIRSEISLSLKRRGLDPLRCY